MYLMLLLFLLYIVFHAIIKATTEHQNLQIIGERMQMVFLTVRFMLLQYMMNCRCKRCAFQEGEVAAVAAWGLTEGWREQNVICRETWAFVAVIVYFCRFSVMLCLSQIKVITKIKRHDLLAGFLRDITASCAMFQLLAVLIMWRSHWF